MYDTSIKKFSSYFKLKNLVSFGPSWDAACCSYLALVAALASEADQVFIPEDPVPNNWVEKLCKRLQQVCRLN